MNRETGEKQPTDINLLVDEYAQLAFHSARANDTNFQLEIKQDLDSSVGIIDVIPQDLGRVFLNLVGNSCQATDDKRLSAGADYAPTVWVSTVRKEEVVEIRIRDNGPRHPRRSA